MKKIPVNQIVDDMVLAQHITGSDGKVLLKAGTKLSSNMGTRLKSWGVQTAFIESSDDAGGNKLPEHSYKKMIDRLDLIFANKLGDVRMQKIYTEVKKHFGGEGEHEQVTK